MIKKMILKDDTFVSSRACFDKYADHLVWPMECIKSTYSISHKYDSKYLCKTSTGFSDA